MRRPSVAPLLLALLPGALSAQVGDSSAAPRVYEAAEVDSAPRYVDQKNCGNAIPEYFPQRLPDGPRHGRVTYSFIVATDGTIEPASIVATTPSEPAFIEPGRRLLLDPRCRLRPAIKDGHPVRARTRQSFSWRTP